MAEFHAERKKYHSMETMKPFYMTNVKKFETDGK
jgi:hypothetical protein